jgi:hypothetical protein
MTDAEVPQPISDVPSRWGGLTTPQLGWLGGGAALPMILIHAHCGLVANLTGSVPWAAGCVVLGFCSRRGRRLDAYLLDAARFRTQRRRLCHPDLVAAPPEFRAVDGSERWPLSWTVPLGGPSGQ